MAKLRPFYEDVQAHYDLSDDFYQLFLDPTMTYSCAYFQHDDTTLNEAQVAKIDLSLGKCDLRPGMRLLDVGCGWGATAIRAAEKYGVKVVGLTLSHNQHALAVERAKGNPNIEFRLQGGEDFEEPGDRIGSIGALEHFRIERYGAFFEKCRAVLPADGKMMIHSIVHGSEEILAPGEEMLDEPFLDYMRFVKKLIFPGGQVPPRETIINIARGQKFEITKLQSLHMHYARTLDSWAKNLQAAKDKAIELTSETVFEHYMRYLTESAHHFRVGHIDVVQFSMQKSSA